MSLISDLLTPQAILLNIHERDKKEVLEMLARKAASVCSTVSFECIQTAVFEREKISSTAMGSGVAIPHCRHDAIDTLHVFFALSRHGIDWHTQKTGLVYFIFLVIGPTKENEKYLSLLGEISRAGKRKECTDALLDAADAAQILSVFRALKWRQTKR